MIFLYSSGPSIMLVEERRLPSKGIARHTWQQPEVAVFRVEPVVAFVPVFPAGIFLVPAQYRDRCCTILCVWPYVWTRACIALPKAACAFLFWARCVAAC